jgi:hypothetical protein
MNKIKKILERWFTVNIDKRMNIEKCNVKINITLQLNEDHSHEADKMK